MPKYNQYAIALVKRHAGDDLARIYADKLRNPDFIKYTKTSVKKKVLGDLIAHELALTKDEQAEIDAVNDEIKRNLYNQSVYILREVAKRTGRTGELEKQLATMKTLGKLEFASMLENYRQSANYDKAVKGEDEEEPVFVTNDELNDIIVKSADEATIGAPDHQYDELYRFNSKGEYKKAGVQFGEAIVKDIVKALDYDQKVLDDTFSPCFYQGGDVDVSAFKAAARKFLADRMAQYPEENRNEIAFVRESEKLELAMHAYIFPNNGAEYDPALGARLGMSKSDYRSFVSDNVPPSVTAATCRHRVEAVLSALDEDGLDDIAEEYRNAKLLEAAEEIKHLQKIHERRPFFTRFVDYFRRSGEDSTIKRINKQLKEYGFSDKQIKDAVNSAKGEVVYPTVEKRENEIFTYDDLAVSDELLNNTLTRLSSYERARMTDPQTALFQQGVSDKLKQNAPEAEKVTQKVEDDLTPDLAEDNELNEDLYG